MNLEVGEIVDRYTVESFIGAGGMAMVYRVRHNQLHSQHALKVLTITSSTVKRRLLQEGRVQAKLRHPNIVSVTDVVDVQGCPGLIMELVEGPTLDIFLRRHHLTLEQVDKLAAGILSGVAEAHAAGLIHRDLKPANVMLARTSSGLVPKVADFGLVKVLTEDDSLSRTRSGLTMGTPRYMSPEQIRDAKKVDARADVFSLGAILYELVTGEQAFPGDDTLELFKAIDDGRFRQPRELCPEIPARMEQAILGALVTGREDRIQSVPELLAVWRGGRGGRRLEDLPVTAEDPADAPTRLAIAPPTGTLDAIDAAPPAPANLAPAAPSGRLPPRSRPAATRRPTAPAPLRPDPAAKPPTPGDEAADGPTDQVHPSSVFRPATEPEPTGSVPIPSISAPPTSDADVVDEDPYSEMEEERSPRRVAWIGLLLALLLLTGVGFWLSRLGDPSPIDEARPTAMAPSAADRAAGSPPPRMAPVVGEATEPPPEMAPAEIAEVPEPAVPTRSASAPVTGRGVSDAATRPPPESRPAEASTGTEPSAGVAPERDKSLAKVDITGDARRIWLESATGRFSAGEVPAGTYQVTAFFDGIDPVTVGRITLTAGQERVLHCSSALKVCR